MAGKRKLIEVMIQMAGGAIIVGVLFALIISVTGTTYVSAQTLEEYLEDWAQSCDDGKSDCRELADSNYINCVPAEHPSAGFCGSVWEYDLETCDVLFDQCVNELADFIESLPSPSPDV